MKKFVLILLAMSVSWAAFGQNVSALLAEFNRRESLRLNRQQGAAVKFLKVMGYDTKNMIELEILNPETSFVLRDRNGDVCLGDSKDKILRCKNEMGITSVSFQGDAD